MVVGVGNIGLLSVSINWFVYVKIVMVCDRLRIFLCVNFLILSVVMLFLLIVLGCLVNVIV